MNDLTNIIPCCSGPQDQSPEDDEFLAGVCKALGHPARIAIMRKLCECDGCVCGDIVEAMPLAQSTVSEHLRILREAGLVMGSPDGVKRCYCVNPEGLARAGRLVGALLARPQEGGVSC